MNRPRKTDPDPHALTMTGFNVKCRLYSQIRAIMAELGQSDTLLLRALRDGHGITFNSLTEDPMIFYTVSSQQKEIFDEAKVKPTFLQELGMSEVFAFSEDEAIEKFRKLKLE